MDNATAKGHVATKPSGTAVANDATTEANANQPRNLLESFQVRILKLWKLLCLSGITSLVNNSNVDIDFYTTAEQPTKMSSRRFRLKALHTKHIDMRKLSAFGPAHAAEVVKLKVEGKFESLTFIPQDFVIYKKFVFSQENEGELTCLRVFRCQDI